MTKLLKALIVEDNERDAILLLRELNRGGYELNSERVETAEALNAALDREDWDIVLSDYSMPRFSAPAALALVRQRGFDLPFIIVSGTVGEETAVEAMRAGANDFMPKGAMARLLPAIDRELREAAVRAERKKMREQLLISERMASVGMLSASVAHEINNPLAVVLANLEIVLQHLEAPAAPPLDVLIGPLRDAHEAAERVSHIARDLKIFSRSSNEEQRGPVDIERVLESALRMASNEIRHRASVVRQYDKLPPVHGNEARLGQVFLNLLVNAAQAIPEGRASENRITLSIRGGENNRAVVEISDTGTGMPPEVASRVFDPFFTTKAEGVGTGLGLAICHRIVSSLGGDISVESRPGHGTAFSVSLPHAGTPLPKAEAPVAAQSAKRRGRVLVVDDEPMLCATVERILSIEHDVTTFQSAKQALQLLEGGDRFDLILSDVMMPQMTGIEFHEALLRIAPELADKVVFMTGGAFSAEASAFLDRFPHRTIDKPFKSTALRRLVQDLIR
ncbi:response regulator [Bradyrhizobium diazoefficiens]|uniref:response regulator n=1 Tax=Bradyrhizobium diazoefficiens TaxID=1355477 RepID=UPI00190C5A93|nr:response regulator [Bradyrhizobium diazoefficiens]QQO12882.1 response regulator [Bradyrhizobium diazoefficiens]